MNRETAESWRFARASTFSSETAFSHRPRLVAARRGKWGRKRPAGHNRPRLVMRTLCRFLPRDVAIVLIMVGAFVALGLTLRGLAEAGVVPKADSRRLLESSRPRHLSSANPASRAPRRALLVSPLRVYPFFGFLPPNPEDFSAWSSWQPRTWAFNVNDQAVGSLTARKAGYTGLGLSAEASVDVTRGDENAFETPQTDA